MKTSKEVFTRSGGHGPLASVPPPAWFRLLHRVDGGFHFHPHEVGGAAEKDETWAAVRATPFEEEPTALPHPRHRRTLRLSPSQKVSFAHCHRVFVGPVLSSGVGLTSKNFRAWQRCWLRLPRHGCRQKIAVNFPPTTLLLRLCPISIGSILVASSRGEARVKWLGHGTFWC